MDLKVAFSMNVADYWTPLSGSVKIVDKITPIEFLRDYVSSYQPVIVKNLINDWPALKKWNLAHLAASCANPMGVTITPEGNADSIIESGTTEYFVFPAEVQMNMSQFCDLMEHREDDDAVAYLSQQNDNLRKEFSHLLEDIDTNISIAEDCFSNSTPEAINLWIGDERSTSSLHKDHFENMYAVISGEKIFTLFPPTDIAFLCEKKFITRKYAINSDVVLDTKDKRIKKRDIHISDINLPSDTLTWISDNPDRPMQTLLANDSYKYTHPITCTVRAGEVLYIPAMWYHQVTQNQLTIAVNFWYDQVFDFR